MKRGLLVDDDPVYISTLRRSLERRNFEIATASDGSDAVQAAGNMQPDFILLDLKLAGESGLDLIAPLRAACATAYLVVVTGYASVATAVEAIKRGADDYLAKPANIATILRVLDGGSSMDDDDQDMLMTPLSRVEWEHIQQAMLDCDGNVSAAARLLGMHRRTLQRKLAKRPSADGVRTSDQ